MPRTAEVWYRPERREDRWLSEGPRAIIHQGQPAVAWINIQESPDSKSGSVFVRPDGGEVVKLPQPQRPGFIAQKADGELWLGMEKDLGVLTLATNTFTKLATIPDASERTIINDGEPTPDGSRILFGTKDLDFKEPIAAMYQWNLSTHEITVVADEQTCSNGKIIEEYGRGWIMHDIDTPQHRINVYDYDAPASHWIAKGMEVDLSAYEGSPDGMCAFGDGSAVIAMYAPGRAAGYALRIDLATGREIERFTVPGSPRVTCPLVRDTTNGRELILTTCIEKMPTDEEAASPNAGCLFVVKLS